MLAARVCAAPPSLCRPPGGCRPPPLVPATNPTQPPAPAPRAQQVCADSMSFDLPAAALAGAIEELGTAAELAAAKGDAPVNIFNALGEQGARVGGMVGGWVGARCGWVGAAQCGHAGPVWRVRASACWGAGRDASSAHTSRCPRPTLRMPAADRAPSMAAVSADLHRARAVLVRLEQEIAKLKLHPGGRVLADWLARGWCRRGLCCALHNHHAFRAPSPLTHSTHWRPPPIHRQRLHSAGRLPV